MTRVVNCRGMVCPQPVIETKEALATLAEGELEVIVDNEASRSNVERFARSQGCTVSVRETDGEFHLLITKPAGARPAEGAQPAEEYTCPAPGRGTIYVFPADTMGRGDDELGRVLIRAFVKTIAEVTPLPERMFFYNSGVRLTAVESDLIPPLRALADQGVGVYSCGTCLDFFHLKEQLLVGEVTNMYEILSAMNQAARVVSPF